MSGRVAFPLFPLALLRQPTIWRSDALAACHGAALVSMVTFLPLYLHIAQGVSAAGAGLLLLPLMFGIGTGSMVTGRTVSRTGYTTIFPSVGLDPGHHPAGRVSDCWCQACRTHNLPYCCSAPASAWER